MRTQASSSVLLLAVAVLCVLGVAHASKHVWEVQSKTCMVRKDCPTVVLKGAMSGPNKERKWEFGKFSVREVFPHYTRASKDSHWKITLVDRESAKGNVRRLLLPGGSHSKSPIKMCCSFFDHRNPTVRCKVNDYLQNVNPNDKIKLLFGPRRPKEEQLWQRLPKRGPVDFEIQDRRRRCKVRKGAQFVIIHSGKSLPADNGVGLSAHFQAKKATIHTLNVEDKWFATLGRIDSNDREEEPERLCCSINNEGKDNENTELKCLSKGFFKRITKGSAIQVWTASARRPRRNKLAHQMKCQGFPQPTPQGWSPLAFPDPIPDDVAEKAARDATAAMKSLETMVRK